MIVIISTLKQTSILFKCTGTSRYCLLACSIICSFIDWEHITPSLQYSLPVGTRSSGWKNVLKKILSQRGTERDECVCRTYTGNSWRRPAFLPFPKLLLEVSYLVLVRGLNTILGKIHVGVKMGIDASQCLLSQRLWGVRYSETCSIFWVSVYADPHIVECTSIGDALLKWLDNLYSVVNTR